MAKIKKNENIAFIGIEREEKGPYEAVINPKPKFIAITSLTRKKLSHDSLGNENIQMINTAMLLVNGLDNSKISKHMDDCLICLESK